MIENFIEYMWYLLTTPLKKLKRSLNKWYILCKVYGRRFDEVKEDILRAVMLEPHTAAELSIDVMAKMIDELIEAHGEYMAMYH